MKTVRIKNKEAMDRRRGRAAGGPLPADAHWQGWDNRGGHGGTPQQPPQVNPFWRPRGSEEGNGGGNARVMEVLRDPLKGLSQGLKGGLSKQLMWRASGGEAEDHEGSGGSISAGQAEPSWGELQ